MKNSNSGAIRWKIEKIVKKGEYLYAVVKDHPKANKYGYVLAHRIVAENKLGRLLNSNEVVHHINGDKKDNRPENLFVETNSNHVSKHMQKHGRKWVSLKCPMCGEIFYRPENQTHLHKKSNYTMCSRSCNGRFSRKIQLHGLTSDMKNAISGNIVRRYKKYYHDNPEETS